MIRDDNFTLSSEDICIGLVPRDSKNQHGTSFDGSVGMDLANFAPALSLY